MTNKKTSKFEKRKFNFSMYMISKSNDLAIDNGKTYYCRERFHADYRRGMIGFKGGVLNSSRFIKLIEDHLNLPLNGRAVYFLTQKNGWIAINPKWWRGNKARIFLFTILLRASKNKNLKTTLNDLYKFGYLKSTKQALDLFLKGNTDCSDILGWVQDLCNQPFKLYNNKIKLKHAAKINEVQDFLNNSGKLNISPDTLYHIVNMLKD